MSKEHLDYLALSLLCDDMLDKKVAEAYHRHLTTCKSCEQAYDDFLAMSFAMAKLEHVEPPKGYEKFTQSILAQLPEQDEVSQDKVIEIQEHKTKKDFFASLDLQQVGTFVALAAVAVLAFLPQSKDEVVQLPSSVMSTEADSASGQASVAMEEEGLVMSGERAMAEPEEEDAVSVATPVVETAEFSEEELMDELDSCLYFMEEGLTYSQDEALVVMQLILEMRESVGSMEPVVLQVAEKITELEGTWGTGDNLSYTTRTFEEVEPYLDRFPDDIQDNDGYFLLVAFEE